MAALKKIKNRYEIKTKLGEGGMGIVYRCYDPPPMNRDVALKTLLEFPDKMSLQLFYKECEVLKTMAHPNIIEIFDIGEFQDEGGHKKPFFVMPLLPGRTLEELIRDDSHRLTVERVVDIIAQTCRGLYTAHERGLIHRDLKPSNIFVMEDDSVKIIDFGVAHTIDSHSRSSGFQKGTLLYMAPEQIAYKPVSPQSDIFSLGVVCYEAMTRRQPFRGTTEEEVVNAILKTIPPPAADINPAVSQLISRVVHKAMAKQPWNRYDNAREFGETLQKALRNEPIELFDPARIQPRIQRANKAFESGDYQFAGEIITELEAEGNIDPQISLLRTQIDQIIRQKTISQLLESARARYEEEEDPLALLKIQEILQLDPNHAAALGLKSKIEERRSERQVEKWFKLATQHVENHAYSHARQALQNVLQLRPKETRANRLMSEIEREEEEYLKLRKQKSEIYQNALNAWKNGDVSVALSQMGLVLDLDRKAPDTASPELSGTYQSFYNKVRSEHDNINKGYAEARRFLAEREYDKALKICDEILAKYPGQALFQAVRFDIVEQQRQQLSSFIADVDRRLEAERDLDAKVSLLREALSSYPKEPHFESSLKLVTDKRDLVNSIVARARTHEERGQISEAVADMEILRTIYSPYPGLQFEIERLEKRREQQSRDSAKAAWVEQVDRRLGATEYERALEILQKAQVEFPNDAELVELQKLAQQGFERSSEAQRLLAEGQGLYANGEFEHGLGIIRKAHQLDERNSEIRNALRDLLIERARSLHNTDWQGSETLAQEALELDPNHAEARSLRSQAFDRKREEFVEECATHARRLHTAGDMKAAAAEVDKGLAVYPSEPRLTVIRDTLNKELRQSEQRQARLSDLDELKSLQQKANDAESAELQSIWERSRVVAERYPAEGDVQSVAREVQRIVRARGGNAPTPKPKKQTAKPSVPGVGQRFSDLARQLLAPPRIFYAAGAVGILAVALVGWHFRPRPSSHGSGSESTGTVQIHPTPPGATVLINNKDSGPYDNGLDLQPGEYDVVVSLPGYETVTKHISVQARQTLDLPVTLQPVTQVIRITTPDLSAGEVWLDDKSVGKLENGSLTLSGLADGQHVLRISTPKPANEAAKITFQTAAGAMPVVSSPEISNMQAVVVSTKPGSVRVVSNLGTTSVAVDGKPYGQTTEGSVEMSDLQAGMHELALGQGRDLRRMSFEIGQSPAMEAIVYSDRNVGSVLVMTGEDDVEVYLDGKLLKQHSQHGQLRIPNLGTTTHNVRVAKDGFASPDNQTIQIVKGQEARAQFTLVQIPKLAALAVEHLPAGVQVSLDGATLGTVSANGTLSYSSVNPGEHTVQFTQSGFPPVRITRKFSAGETQVLSDGDVVFKRPPATLEVTLAANMSITVMRGNQSVGHLAASGKLSLEEGTYSVIVRNPNGTETTHSVTVAAGETRPFDLRSSADSNSMDQWTASWTRQDQWFQRKGGGNILYKMPHPSGSIMFTVKMHHGHIFSGGPHLRWVVNFIDDKNFILYEMDNKYLYRTETEDGKKLPTEKFPHNIPSNAQFLNLNIQVSPKVLLQRYSLQDNVWKTLDNWDRSAPSLNKGKGRNFTEGQFGFYLPGNDEVEVSNFSFEQQGRR